MLSAFQYCLYFWFLRLLNSCSIMILTWLPVSSLYCISVPFVFKCVKHSSALSALGSSTVYTKNQLIHIHCCHWSHLSHGLSFYLWNTFWRSGLFCHISATFLPCLSRWTILPMHYPTSWHCSCVFFRYPLITKDFDACFCLKCFELYLLFTACISFSSSLISFIRFFLASVALHMRILPSKLRFRLLGAFHLGCHLARHRLFHLELKTRCGSKFTFLCLCTEFFSILVNCFIWFLH